MSNKIYTSVPVPKFPRNIFSLSRPVVGSMRMQRLYPTEILEVVPGDAFNLRHESFFRTAPLVAPPLAKVTLSHHAFFVPSWQLHQEFDDFITGGEKMDFTDHLPYAKVLDIYRWIDALLSSQYAILADNTGVTFGTAPAFISTSQLLEDIVSIVESFDYSRAIPFSLPEFLPVQSDKEGELLTIDSLSLSDFTDYADTVADMAKVAKSNWLAWRKYNPVSMWNLDLRVNLLPFYAQLKIWCEYFRDENLCTDLWDELKESDYFSAVDYVEFSDGFLTTAPTEASPFDPTDLTSDQIDTWHFMVNLFGTKKRPWKKDRFTSALPWTQKGPDVAIPLSGSIPVSVNKSGVDVGSRASLWVNDDETITRGNTAPGYPTTLVGTGNLDNATGMATMRDLRRAEAVEEFEEADGRFGNRYPENTLGQFGVFTPDSRLPRCQFLGSTKQVLSFSEVAQTSETGSTPLGTLAGKGTSYSPNFLFKRRFTMHGYVVVFTSIQVSALYEQGIHPMFSRLDRTEYAWPRYARLGEEPIYAKEVSIFGENIQEDAVFGYAPRYSTYKSDTGSCHGQLKTTLDYWTMSRRLPIDKDAVLSQDFIYNDPRRDAFAITNPFAETFYFEIDWKVRASRLLPFYGVASI